MTTIASRSGYGADRALDRLEPPRALTVDQTAGLTGLLRASARAVALDLPDLVDWMLATGCRIGEALATGWSPIATGGRC